MLTQTVRWARVISEHEARQWQLLSLDRFKRYFALCLTGGWRSFQFRSLHFLRSPCYLYCVFVHLVAEAISIHRLVRPTVLLPPIMEVAKDNDESLKQIRLTRSVPSEDDIQPLTRVKANCVVFEILEILKPEFDKAKA